MKTHNKAAACRFLLLILGLSLYDCGPKKNITHIRTTSELVQVLSADSLEGRRPGTIGFEKAAQYVEEYLIELEIKPFFNDSYRDSLPVRNAQSFNIVGVIESRKSTDEYILIGAHLDHLGMRRTSPDSIFNGANDNASGVTAVLQIGRELAQLRVNKNVILALFTGEESGLIGSRHLAKRLKDAGINLEYMINFEMIGQPLTSSPFDVYITGYNMSNFAETANEILMDDFIVYEGAEFSDRLFRASDNFPFYSEYEIPAHTISTFDFKNDSNFHRPADEFSYLNIQHMDTIIDKTSEILIGLLEGEDHEISISPDTDK
jgi:hypothetical protein